MTTVLAITFEQLKRALFSFDTVSDVLDILLVTFVIYNAIKIIKETRAFQLAKGVILLAFVYFLVSLFNMEASSFLLNYVFGNLFIILVIVFSPEIRHALESVGRSKVSKFNFFGLINKFDENEEKAVSNAINCVCKACSEMSDKKIGALIVFEKDTILGEISQTGTQINADVTTELIGNIFFPKAPLHDGAVVIKNGRIVAGGCILPLTDKSDVSSDLGTRHRAAIGMSEVSDAVVTVVSEETGAISVAQGGKLSRNISVGDLREILDKNFINKSKGDDNKFKKMFKGGKNDEQSEKDN